MKFFQKKHSVCAECGVHFEPVTGYEARWGQFCGIHRTERRQSDEKKDLVLAWAAKNIVRLHDQMVAERQAERENLSDYQAAFNVQQEAMSMNVRNAKSATNFPGYYNPFGGTR